MSTKGTIFAIEEFSTFDGPGIRTTVFLKGCPLRCVWCHNPEGLDFMSEIARNVNLCIGCGQCKKGVGFESVKNCPVGALRVCGVEYTPQLMSEKLLKNKSILNSSGGGVTFSGGEPLAQPRFLKEILVLLDGQVHRALQTSGFCSGEIFEDMLENLDYVLFDLKIIDEQVHMKYTGVSNEPIRKNFQTLCRSGVPFSVRVPLIPGITDTSENVTAIASLMQENGAPYAELMPYNKMAGAKHSMVGREYTPNFNDKADVRLHEDIFARHGITTKIL